MIHFLLPALVMIEVRLPAHNLQHEEVYGLKANEINQSVLAAVDRAQETAPDGGGYFASVKATPPESPIGFPVSMFGKTLLTPPRSTSYCSGASYVAFIGGLDALLAGQEDKLTEDRLEALRLQEPDGKRREDTVKMWGWWNADGPGALYALTMYSGLGVRVTPADAEPGDFCNIDWVKGPGHSVVFLGWDFTSAGEPAMRYWSSQKGTNGLGDQTSTLSSVKGFVFTRLTRPDAVFEFDPIKKMERAKIEYDSPSPVAALLRQSAGR